MKKYLKYIISVVSLVAIVSIAVFGYNYLSSRYQPEEFKPETTAASSEIKNSSEKAKKAPDFTVINSEGAAIQLSNFYGKPVVINFWATWCGPCKSELPAFNKLYSENKDEIVFLMINLTDGHRDTVSNVKSFISDNGYNFPVYFDTEYSAANAYSVSSVPMTLFIDENGAIRNSHIGMMSESILNNYLSALLDKS